VIDIRPTTTQATTGKILLTFLLVGAFTAVLFSGCTQQTGQPIVLVGRDSASGTREFFYNNVMQKTNFSATLLEKNSNGAVEQTVAQTKGAVGYVGLGFLGTGVKAITIDNVTPTIDNVINGRYPISRELYMFTKGQATGAAAEFILFLQSTEGQAIVTQQGFVPLQNTTAYNHSGKTLSGILTVSGSTTVLPIAESAATAFKAIYPSLTVTVSGGGSGAGISAVSQGTVDIGMSSRDLQPSEANLGLVKHVIGKDGIAIIINPQNTYVTNLSLTQLKHLYQGTITNW
jgi:phosphate transport system substrate-binding protein